MVIGPVSFVVLLILKVVRGQHSVILADPDISEKPARFSGRVFHVQEVVIYEMSPNGSRVSRKLGAIQRVVVI